MTQKKPPIEYITLPEFAYIYDESDQKRVVAYRTDYRRQKTVYFVDHINFNTANEVYTSEPFHCAGYRDALLLVNLDVTGAPTDIYIDIQFSDDFAIWYKYMLGPFGDLRWEDAAGDKKESLNFPVLAPYIRLYLVSAGCEQGAEFLMNVKVIFNG